MTYIVSLEDAKKDFPQFEFIAQLTPSEQKAAFHVRNKSDRDLCLKLISPSYDIDRLNREIYALQTIGHKNVVRFEEYTYSSKDGKQLHYIVEDFVPGVDLAEKLVKGNPWDRKAVAEFFAELCDGLEALRTANVVHRDLKPNNIRVTPDDIPVIIDFGLARMLSLADLTNTIQGAQIGTPMYFAPEQFEGTKREIDHRTDLFAVGILLYEALIGHHPFYTTGMSVADLHKAICEGEEHLKVTEFDALSNQWQVLLKGLLAKSRAKRFSGAGQVSKLLRLMEKDK